MSLYTLADAMRQLFGIKLAEYTKLKDKVHSLARNGLIRVQSESRVQRNKKYLAESELTTLFNATLLLAFIRHSAPDLGINLPIALTQYLQNDLLVSC